MNNMYFPKIRVGDKVVLKNGKILPVSAIFGKFIRSDNHIDIFGQKYNAYWNKEMIDHILRQQPDGTWKKMYEGTPRKKSISKKEITFNVNKFEIEANKQERIRQTRDKIDSLSFYINHIQKDHIPDVTKKVEKSNNHQISKPSENLVWDDKQTINNLADQINSLTKRVESIEQDRNFMLNKTLELKEQGENKTNEQIISKDEYDECMKKSRFLDLIFSKTDPWCIGKRCDLIDGDCLSCQKTYFENEFEK